MASKVWGIASPRRHGDNGGRHGEKPKLILREKARGIWACDVLKIERAVKVRRGRLESRLRARLPTPRHGGRHGEKPKLILREVKDSRDLGARIVVRASSWGEIAAALRAGRRVRLEYRATWFRP